MTTKENIRAIVANHTAILRTTGALGHQNSRHYTEAHRRAHCTCFKPKDWICEKNNRRFAECGCPLPNNT